MKRIRYYISGHGLGHASRSCQVIQTLCLRHPSISVSVVSDAHPWFFKRVLGASVPVRYKRLDVGVLQQDCLVMREEETLQACRSQLSRQDPLVAEEARCLRQDGIDLVVADIPSLPFVAAARAGVPSVGLSNFSWDWIYEGMLEKHRGYGDVIAALRQNYACADRMLRLPFHGELSAFAAIEELPLVARVGTRDPQQVRRKLGVPEGARLGLVSFGGVGLKGCDFSALAALKGWLFVAESEVPSSGPGLRCLSPGQFFYPDLVRAADVVITKPGYGIVSEAIANDTAVLYTSRGDFREQALLIDGLARYARSLFIDVADFRAGRWGDYLETLMRTESPPGGLRMDGDRVAADRLAALTGCGHV